MFLVLFLLVIVWMWRALDVGRSIGPTSTGTVTDRALGTARERTAKRKIDGQEFERLRPDLAS